MADDFNDLMEKYAPGATKGDSTEEQQVENKEDSPKVEDGAQTEKQPEEQVNKEEDVQANDDQAKEEPKSEATEFNVETFNKTFDGNYENVDQIKEVLELSKKYPELKTMLDEREKVIGEKDEALKTHFNPMEYFADEKEFKINKILKDNKDLNRNVVSRLVYSDIDQMDDKDVLKLNELLSTEGVFDESIVDRAITKKYGLNVSKEDLEEEELKDYQVQEFLMKKDAQKAKGELKKLLEVEIPEFKDPNTLKQEENEKVKQAFEENKSKWNASMDKLLDEQLSKLSIEYQTDDKTKDTFEFEIDGEFKKVLKQNLPQIAASYNKDVTKPEDVNALVEQAHKDYLWLRRGELFTNIHEDIMTKMTKEQIDKYYNTSKPTKAEAPPQLSDEARHNKSERERMMQDFNIKKK